MRDEPIRLIVLGSTGSIGVSTLEVVEHLEQATHRRCEVVALVAGRNAATLAAQARRHRPVAIGLADDSLRAELGDVGGASIHLGEDAALEIVEAHARPGDVVMGAMVGAAGIAPTMSAIRKGCRIALANKETLVAAGSLVMAEIASRNGTILPVDSEHSALFQAMRSG